MGDHSRDTLWVDSDGDIDKLIPLWLDAGVNCLVPIEVGKWGLDPVALRTKYGTDLRMMGGFDKRIMAGSHDEIEAEIERLAPLVDEGGFIPFCDHRVPPQVSLQSYLFYLDTARHVWGHDTNLIPMSRPDTRPLSS